tara:strand:+ start:7025 stop:7990 length:966 start_codon:yes stop_codon:yes gene_type:complete
MELQRVTVGMLPEFSGANVESAEAYFRAKHTILPLLNHRVIDPFEKLLRKDTGYDKDNLPSGEVEHTVDCVDLEFVVVSSRKVKRPKIKEVYTGTVDYLKFVKEGYAEGIQRKGVLTFDDKAYLELGDLLGKIDSLQKSVLTDDLKQSITRPDWAYDDGDVVIPLVDKLGLNDNDARLYLNALGLEKVLKDKTVKPFDDYLKTQTGYHKDNVPKEVESKLMQINQDLFEVQTIPEKTVKYKEIMKDLVKPAPTKVTSRSRIGELIRVRDNIPFEKAVVYDPRQSKGSTYVSVEGSLLRLDELKKKHTNPSVNQKVFYYRAV